MISRFGIFTSTIDWTSSIARCERLKKNQQEHKTHFSLGDMVKCTDGFKGQVTHMEFIRYDQYNMRDVYYIEVTDRAYTRCYTNPMKIQREL